MKKALALFLTMAMFIACTPAFAEGALFKAGAYTTSADGNNGPVKVPVTLSEDRIESVEVLSHEETPGVCDAAIEAASR